MNRHGTVAVCFWLLLIAGMVAIYWQPAVFFGSFLYRDLVGPRSAEVHLTPSEEIADCKSYPELRYTHTCILHFGRPDY